MSAYPNQDPQIVFGQDLTMVFGPKAQRKHINTFTAGQKRAILARIPVYVSTDDLGDRPSFYQITNKILTVLMQTKALVGIDLDWINDAMTGGLVRSESQFVSVDKCFKNNRTQRGIFLRHLVQDILFCFDIRMFLTGLARRLSDGTFNLNDAQHRNVAAIILGIRMIPIDWIASDLESVDIDQYACVNLNSLAASEYDFFRIRVARHLARIAEGRTDLDPMDQLCYEMFLIHQRYMSRFVEKGKEKGKGSDRVMPLECTGVGIMQSYFERYGASVYERALAIVTTVWSRAQLSTANCWGLMEFITEQINEGIQGDNPSLMDWEITQCLLQRYSDPGRSGMHLDIKRAFDKGPYSELDIPEPRKIAAGIWKICKVHSPKIKWARIKYNGKNIADYLDNFKIMPNLAQAA